MSVTGVMFYGGAALVGLAMFLPPPLSLLAAFIGCFLCFLGGCQRG